MRGIRLFATAAALGAIIVAQFSAFVREAPVAHAADQLPGSVAEMVKQFDTQIASTTSNNLNYRYYTDNKLDASNPPTTFPAYNGAHAGSNGRDIFLDVYNNLYADLSQLNEDWINQILLGTLNDKLFPPDQTTDQTVAQFNTRLTVAQDIIHNKMVANIASVYFGFKILNVINASPTAKASLIAYMGESVYSQKLKDLDTIQQTKHLVKLPNLATRLQAGTLSSNSSQIYYNTDGSGGWYPDFYPLANVILATAPLTDDASVKDLKAKVIAAAQGIDGSSGGADENPQDSCPSNGLSPTTWLPSALCNLTVTFRDMGSYLLVSSGSLLAKTSGLPGGASSDNSTGLFSFVNNSAVDGLVQDKLQDSNMGAVALVAYARILNITNGMVLLLLIGIALANILQIQINTYSLKKMLPGLIIGLILANASYFIVRAGLEISGYLSNGLITQQEASGTGKSTDDYITSFKNFGYVNQDPHAKLTKANGADVDLGLVFQQIVLNCFLWLAAILVLILAFIFAIRSLIFFFLVPLAPIAFIGLYFPPLGFAWKRWSAMMVSWTFMPVVAFFWLWLGFIWFASVSDKAGPFGYFLGYVFGIAMFWLAMKSPFTLAGEAKTMMNKWSELGQGAAKKYTPYGTGLRAYNQIKANNDARSKLSDSGLIVKGKLAQKLGGGLINAQMAKSELRTGQMKSDQDAAKEKVMGQAMRKLVEGHSETIKKWQESNSSFLRGLGEKLEKASKGYGKVETWMGSKGLMTPMTYAGRDAHIRDLNALGKVAKTSADSTLTSSYYDGDMGVVRSQRDFEATSYEGAATKAKSDSEMKAAHRYLTDHINKGHPLLGQIAATGVANPPADVKSLVNFNTTGLPPDLKREVDAYKRRYKNLYKASARFITKKQKEDAADNAKKEVAEISFNPAEVNDFTKMLTPKLDASLYDPKKGEYDGVAPTDNADYTSRAKGLLAIAVSANNLDKVPEAHNAAQALGPIAAVDPNWTAQLNAYDAAISAAGGPNGRTALNEAIRDFKQGSFYKEIVQRESNPHQNYKA